MLDKHFDFQTVENKHYTRWEKSGKFAPNMNAEEVLSIMMPPPNVTGTLHLGHALDNTLPDILIRRARMQGKAALYQPGCDHASIAVHVVLERQWRSQGKTRFDMGRDAFLAEAWKWKEHSHEIITSQLRRLGISCDWSNERFTMDEKYSKAVSKVFIDLYNRGLIYRGQRLVNWDPVMQTAVSDLEVKHKEIQGHLWHFNYPFSDKNFTYKGENGIQIATTRPETILADGAIAINPNDPRAKALVGQKVTVPIVNREIFIIADDYVDPDFGSGMVKITAAHDVNDFEVYKRHKKFVDIPLINLMNPDATMNENCPQDYVGLDRFDARKKVIEDFKSLGLFVKAVDHVNNVGHAERDDVILEPYLTNQWYVKMDDIAKRCLEEADKGNLKFVNVRDEKVYRHWLENIQDWCISRQLWWGHRIPAWYKNGEIIVSEDPPKGEGWTQDEDILDTWFSSALWPFVTQGWPEETARVKKLYPATVNMNGRDILFFWDVRMVAMGLLFMDELPFGTIYTHGMINDEQGQKMSKSKGNVIDPLEMMDEYGTDAVRFFMASIASAEDMRMSAQKLEQMRNFVTKLWNASRFMEMNGVHCKGAEEDIQPQHSVNKWIVSELKQLFNKFDQQIDKYEFNQATYELYHFTWGTWCDWYLELTKPLLNGKDVALAEETRATMGWAFEKLLRVLHPVIPFVTEELWQQLTEAPEDKMLMTTQWPKYKSWADETEALEDVRWLQEVISSVRNARTQLKVPPKARIQAGIRGAGAEYIEKMHQYLPFLTAMAGISGLSERTEAATESDMVAVAHGAEIILPLEGIIDFAAEKERIMRQIEKYEAEIEKIEKLLGNPGFIERAPEAVVTQNRAKQADLQKDLDKLKASAA